MVWREIPTFFFFFFSTFLLFLLFTSTTSSSSPLVVLRTNLFAYQDRITSKQLMASPQRVTRSKVTHHRGVFPFLYLSGEIRNWIYQFSVGNMDGLNEFLEKYYKKYLDAKTADTWYSKTRNRRLRSPKKSMKTPNVFLINKQIAREACYIFFSTRSVSFDHGLLEIKYISEFISPKVLQNLTKISITDSGHNEIIQLHEANKTQALPASWNGYIRMLTQLGALLAARGHNLQSFTIDFSRDKRLGQHMVDCWDAAYQCGFADQMRDALDFFNDVRGVKNVTLIGLNPTHARKLKHRMQSKKVQFSDLPVTVRNRIYAAALSNWGKDINVAIADTIRNWTDKTMSVPYPLLSTPTVLLMNKQYSAEALEVFQKFKKTLVILISPVHSIPQGPYMKLSRFIGRETLKGVGQIAIWAKSQDALKSLDRFFVSALAASDAKLKKFRVDFDDVPGTARYRHHPDGSVFSELERLTDIRGLQHAWLSGMLPSDFSRDMEQVMTSRVVRSGGPVDANVHRPAY
jgi:hypothetical protein